MSNVSVKPLSVQARPFAAALLEFDYAASRAPVLVAALEGQIVGDVHRAFAQVLSLTREAMALAHTGDLAEMERLLHRSREAMEVVRSSGAEEHAWDAIAVVNAHITLNEEWRRGGKGVAG